MRALNARGSSGRHLRLDGFCQRQAASPPSGLLPLAVTCAWVVSVSGRLLLRPRASRPSPSHRYAAGPSLYKRGCLRLRNSPAASRPSVPPAAASRVQNSPSCPRLRPAIASRVQNGHSCTRLRTATVSRVQNSPFCPRPRPTGEPGGDGRWSEGGK
jgi:hypothetical protein